MEAAACAGNWAKVARWVRENKRQSIRTIVVFFTDDRTAAAPEGPSMEAATGDHEFHAPFAWSQIALAMLRVLHLKAKDDVGVFQWWQLLPVACRTSICTQYCPVWSSLGKRAVQTVP